MPHYPVAYPEARHAGANFHNFASRVAAHDEGVFNPAK
jgi:hypothetical protein